MLKRIFSFIILLLSINIIFAANVNLSINVGDNETIFNYVISFKDNENYDSFSLEKPSYSNMIYVKDDSNDSQLYSVAGDYFIFKSDKKLNQNYYIKFMTKTISKEINQNNRFKTYINFNFPVQNFDLKVNFSQKYNTVDEIFPREYSILKDGRFEWKQTNLEKDSLFLINFKDKIVSTNNSSNSQIVDDTTTAKLIDKYMILLIIISFIFLVVFLFGIKKIMNIVSEKNKVVKVISKDKQVITENLLDNNVKEEIKVSNEEINESFEDFIDKYLTENEKEVILVIVDNEGILQNEILNFIPSMKKSNLSKIITKLHSRRILDRIKVGKVNKIHIGSKLKVILDRDKED